MVMIEVVPGTTDVRVHGHSLIVKVVAEVTV
jgi:hypothetical protein